MSFYELPGRHRFSAPSWGDIRVDVLSAEDHEQLTKQVNLLVASPDLNVLAFSAPTTTATFVAEPWHCTVVLQERVDPNAGSPS